VSIEIHDGFDSKLLLSNPIFQKALEDIESDLCMQWLEPGTSPEHREELFQEVQALRRIVDKLNTFITLAERAELEINQ
jgi:hypothetical protein